MRISPGGWATVKIGKTPSVTSTFRAEKGSVRCTKKDVQDYSEARNCITIENDENPGLRCLIRIGEGGSTCFTYTGL